VVFHMWDLSFFPSKPCPVQQSQTFSHFMQCKEKTLYKNVDYPVGCYAICNVQHKGHNSVVTEIMIAMMNLIIAIVILITASTVIIVTV
jgi:hypothetical protein